MRFRKKSNKPVSRYQLNVSGLEVEVVRKNIKNLRLTVHPPDGQVRVSVPLQVDDDAVRSVVNARLEWIQKHQRRFKEQDRPPEPRLVSGENVYVFGQTYRLKVIERYGTVSVRLVDDFSMEMRLRPGSSTAQRAVVLDEWYRKQLRQRVPELIAKWEPVIGVDVAEWRIRKMKTRWGTCNIGARRIWLNLELARRSLACLEFIVVHEMVHLLERSHNERFKRFMDNFMPDWRVYQDELEREPLV